jgi:molecular chaperone DnaK
MISEAERHSAEDKRLREEVDARNELDSIAYQVERRLSELGDSVPLHEKARAEQLIADARQAVQDQAPVDRVRPLTAELQQIFHGLSAARAGSSNGDGDGDGRAQGQGNGNGRSGRERESADDDDVIDADFTVS